MKMRHLMIPVLCAMAMPMSAGELPPALAAKLVALVIKSANDGMRVACKAGDMAGELSKLGIENNPSAKIAWASSSEEARMYALQGKCVIVADPKFLPIGGALAVFEDGGKPKMMVNSKNLQKSGVSLSDQILRAAAGGG